MSWNERLRQAAYTSPSGIRVVFAYEDVSREIDKKGTAFQFPDAEGTYVQSSGNTGRRFPIRAFFSGEDCDILADNFDTVLLENGIGKLEHPRYGVRNVVPFGTINQDDELKTSANQSVINVTFWDTIDLLYPASQTDAKGAIGDSLGAFNSASADQLYASIDSAPSSLASFKSKFQSLLGSAKSGLQAVADVQANVQSDFNAINRSINDSIDILVATPLTLAFQTVLLIQTPARSIASISARLSAYKNLAQSIFSGEGAGTGNVSVSGGGQQSTNAAKLKPNYFHAADIFASAYTSGFILAAVNAEFTDKPSAIRAAAEIIDQMDALAEWRDNSFKEIADSSQVAEQANTDTGEAFQKLQDAAMIAAGYLVDLSFSLKQERVMILDRSRTIVDLCAELYGEVDSKLDFMIMTNNLTGPEIYPEIPVGRRIVYYV